MSLFQRCLSLQMHGAGQLQARTLNEQPTRAGPLDFDDLKPLLLRSMTPEDKGEQECKTGHCRTRVSRAQKRLHEMGHVTVNPEETKHRIS